MANYIVTEIEITGEKETLQKIYNAIVYCNDLPASLDDGSDNNWVGNIFRQLHMNSKLHTSGAFWYGPRFNKYGHLVFTEECRWKRSKCGDILKRHFAQEISGVNYMCIQ